MRAALMTDKCAKSIPIQRAAGSRPGRLLIAGLNLRRN